MSYYEDTRSDRQSWRKWIAWTAVVAVVLLTWVLATSWTRADDFEVGVFVSPSPSFVAFPTEFRVDATGTFFSPVDFSVGDAGGVDGVGTFLRPFNRDELDGFVRAERESAFFVGEPFFVFEPAVDGGFAYVSFDGDETFAFEPFFLG